MVLFRVGVGGKPRVASRRGVTGRSVRAVANSADGPERRRETKNPVDSVSSRSRREAARREQARRDREKRPSRREQRGWTGATARNQEPSGSVSSRSRREAARRKQARRDREKRPSRREQRGWTGATARNQEPSGSVSSRSRREAARREQARRDREKRPSAREQGHKERRRPKNRLAEGQRHFRRVATYVPSRRVRGVITHPSFHLLSAPRHPRCGFFKSLPCILPQKGLQYC